MKPKAKHPTIVSTVWTGLATLVMLTASCRPLIGREVSPTNSMLFISSTPSPSLLPPTPTASVTPSASPSPTPSPTPPASATPTMTWTPLPTMPPAQVQALVLDLLTNNADCHLPCWWGIKSGETSWVTARHFLDSFATHIGRGGTGSIAEGGVIYLTTNYSVAFKGAGKLVAGQIYELRNGVVSGITVGTGGTQLSYQLHQMLTTYGSPTAVFLRTSLNIPYAPGSSLPFRVVLFYPQQGILAYYEYGLKVVGDQILGCPEVIGPELYLWSPEQRTLLLEDIDFLVLGPDTGVHGLRSLEEATDLDIETFYEIFKNPDNKVCIETPVEFWP